MTQFQCLRYECFALRAVRGVAGVHDAPPVGLLVVVVTGVCMVDEGDPRLEADRRGAHIGVFAIADGDRTGDCG